MQNISVATIFFLVWLVVLTGCHSGISGTQLPSDDIENLSLPPFEKELIVYVSYTDGSFDGEIYVMNVDGSEQIRLTNHEANDSAPVWSPDGRKIAFTSNREGLTRVYIMNADGSQIHRLTKSQGISEIKPKWSPDGKSIVFLAISTDGKATIQLVDLASGETREIVDSKYALISPAWSPDSQFVWFASSIAHSTVLRNDLYTVHIKSGDIQRITTFNGSDGWRYDDIAISPDGLHVLHSPSSRDPAAYLLNLQTLEVSYVFAFARNREIYPEFVDRQSGANWSPDGNAIVFSMGTDNTQANLYRFDFQSEQITQLTSGPGHEMSADWWAP
jgi:Tol biopolymer transport system component